MSAEPVAGFTPAPDCIRDDIDIMAALVFGAVWRYGRQTSGTCTASVETIAERAGIGTTATRIRLAKLAERGWIIAKTRVGQPTVYRDAGRWTVTLVGQEVPQTPTANVGVPLRQTLGSDTTPTANVGVPQRLALPKILSKIQDIDHCDAATADVAALSPMQTTQSAHAVEVPPPSTPAISPWLPLASTMAGDLEGRPSAARTKAGTITAFYGQLVGVFGAKCNDDPAASAATWRRFVTAMKAQRMKDGRPVWSIIRKSNVLEQAGRWLADDNGQAEGLRPGYAIDPETGRLYVADWSLIP